MGSEMTPIPAYAALIGYDGRECAAPGYHRCAVTLHVHGAELYILAEEELETSFGDVAFDTCGIGFYDAPVGGVLLRPAPGDHTTFEPPVRAHLH